MKIGIIGLGIMGTATAQRLLQTSHQVIVHNRSKEKALALLDAGAHWSSSPADLASKVDIVITMVKDPEAVRAITLGDDGILSSIGANTVHSEMSTITPQCAEELATKYQLQNRQYVQATVLGSKKQILDSTLLIMAGGSEQSIAQCETAWQAFSKRIWKLETASQAAAIKLSCNMLIAQMILGLGQSLVFADAYGVDKATLLDLLDASALGAPMYKSKGQSLSQNNFQANFTVDNMLKDVTLASQALSEAGRTLPPNELAHNLFEQATAAGFGHEDYSAVVKVLMALKSS